jgi:hypothetical protein
MASTKELTKVAKSTAKDAQRAAKDLKGYKGLGRDEKLGLLKKAVFVAGVLAFVAVRAKNRSAK